MKQVIFTVIAGLAFCLGGCASGSLSPHEALNQSVTQSFDASGFNYTSQTRITDLAVPAPDAAKEGAEKQKLNYLAGLGVIKGLAIRGDGAIDMKVRKSELLYDIRYDKDNVEVSIKLPVMMDYNTQTIYVGTSILTTILETAYPQAPSTRGKLIKIDLAELLKETAKDQQELAKLLGEGILSPKNFDAMNGAFKTALQKSVAKLSDAGFSDQPLTENDRKAGVERRVRMQLGQEESITFILDLVDGVVQGLVQSGIINKEVADLVQALTNRQQLAGYTDKFTLAVTVEAGIGRAGYVSSLDSRLQVADREGAYRLGVENINTFANYGAPRFTMTPETAGLVDFKDILAVIAADLPGGDEACVDEGDDAPEEPNAAPMSAPGQS